jgi:penicillin-binding protein 2
LRGTAGGKSVLVNNAGYRQSESVWSAATPGHNVVLTLDLRVQQAAEEAILKKSPFGANTRGAVVVMDVNTGDILAMVSSPSINPSYSVFGYPPGEWQRLRDPVLRPEINRATQENYMPGSIFKTVVGMACLEDGLDTNEVIYNPGFYLLGRHHFTDLAEKGDYNFRRALVKSSNTYFITVGLRTGPANIARIGQRLHLGERIGLPTYQETPGTFPTVQRVSSHWSLSDTANLSIGQGVIDVTPLQMAVMTAAIANGGKVLRPRLVQRIEPIDPASNEPVQNFPSGVVRDQLGVSRRTLDILREAMLEEVQEAEGTGKKAAVTGMQICGKTGTAQKKDLHGVLEEHHTWFVSFAPYETPRYAVVVMVEVDASVDPKATGGKICAPVAREVYLALQARDNGGQAKAEASAGVHRR